MQIPNLEIRSELPLWFIVFCIFTGVLYAFLLYYKDKASKNALLSSKFWIYLLAFLRVTTVSIIAFMLLNPLLQSNFRKTQKPVIIIAQDNSASIEKVFKKETDLNAYTQSFNDLIHNISKSYDVATYSFGNTIKEGISYSFNDKTTNISSFLSGLYNQYMNQNVGAIIIASDGIYNQGQHPLYLKQQLPVPIYTIALGDTTPQKDLILRKVHHNKIVYLSNQFSIHIDIQAQNCNKEQTDLLVKKIGRNDEATIVHKKSISIENDYFEDNIPVILEANKAGILHYRIILSPVKQEVTIANNVQDIYIEVLDSKQKILILAGSPHPDIAAIKQAIESNENYEVHARLVSEFKENINEYSLLILHQLPNRQDNINKVLNLSNNVRIPVLYIIGANTSIFAFNNIQNILKIDNKSAKSLNEVQANVDKDFALFSLSEHSINNIEKYPPLLVHFGYYTLSPSAAILAYQRIGTASTKYPLLVFSQTLDSKIGILCGEGFWRWRIYDYVNNKDHNTTNALFSKIVQYLSVKTDKRKFKVMIEKSIFNETEPVTFDAELYNASYELTNEPDVTIIITNEKGKEFPFVFSKTGNAYLLDAGAFSPGSYTYEAKVTFNNKTQTLKGQFSVLPLRLEAMQSTADHQLLYQLSDNSGGQLVYPNELEKIANMLQQMKDIKPMSYTEYKTEALINLKWICFLLLFLLGSEWFIRKWNGSY